MWQEENVPEKPIGFCYEPGLGGTGIALAIPPTVINNPETNWQIDLSWFQIL